MVHRDHDVLTLNPGLIVAKQNIPPTPTPCLFLGIQLFFGYSWLCAQAYS